MCILINSVLLYQYENDSQLKDDKIQLFISIIVTVVLPMYLIEIQGKV